MTTGKQICALGLMSGTSMDGADAAMIEGDGTAVAPLGGGGMLDYSETDRRALKAAAADAAQAGAAARAEDFASVAQLVAERAAEAAEKAIVAAEGRRPDLVGFHGQTLFHAPESRFTLQVGDADWLSAALGAPVIHDFRSADVAAGGQGAPFAPFYHFALARRADLQGSVALLNLGGVGNVTVVSGDASAPDEAGALLAFDTGPANALLDDWMALRTGEPFDAEGATALSGVADLALVRRWVDAAPFFKRPPPKAIDRDIFRSALEDLDAMTTADGAATLVAFTVETVAIAAGLLPEAPAHWFVTGGGRRNPAILRGLSERLGAVRPVEALGADGDLLEAEAFAHLAIRASRGMTLSAPGTTGVPSAMSGGVRVDP